MVAGADPESAIERVKARLVRTLPRHMIPSRVVALEALPRTITGKIDRLRLPPPGRARPSGHVPAAPATAIEAGLLTIWRRGLQCDDFAVDDDFFDAGGHSLMATRIVVAVRAAFDIDLPIRSVFELRTVRNMARAIAARRGAPRRTGPRAGVAAADLILAPQQRNFWFNECLTGRLNPSNILVALRLRGALHVPALEHAAARCRRGHATLRTALVPDVTGEPRPSSLRPTRRLCTFRPSTSPVCRGCIARARLDALCAAERSRPLDLTRAPLPGSTSFGSAPAITSSPSRRIVACDGWSIEILTREFSAYAAACAGVPAALADLPFQ